MNFFSLEDHVSVVAIVLTRNPIDRPIQKPTDPKIAWKNKNRKVEKMIVAMKVPMTIYNA